MAKKKAAVSPPVSDGKKTIEELAIEICAGLWGSGEYREKAIRAAGYDWDAVKKRVNQIKKGRNR